LGIKTSFLDSKRFSLLNGRVERLVSLLQQVGATEYLSGPTARGYLAGSAELFAEAGIRVLFKEYVDYPEYRQLRTPFEHRVSIVDLLANVDLGECPRFITGRPPG
jgi:hypothetical protein